MKKKSNSQNIIFLLIIILFSAQIFAQKITEPSPIKWYTIEEAEELNKKYVKPYLIDVYTEWCGWCKHMMKTTFANKNIASYINKNFYPIRFDAESTDTILYKGKKYFNEGKGKGKKNTHNLAKYLLKNRLSYPSIVYTDRKGTIYPIPGYMKIKDIEPVLVYFAEDNVTNVNFEDFRKYFWYNSPKIYKDEINKLPDSIIIDTLGKINWLTFEEVDKLSKKNKKPIFISFYTDWCISCKIYNNVVLKNSIITEIINANFYTVRFNAASQDTINVFGQKLTGNGIGQPHQFTTAIFKQNYKMPADVYINEKNELLNITKGFLTAKQLESILMFYAQKAYLKKKYSDFLKDFSNQIKN